MDALGVLENFNGFLCHDHWKPYFQYECLHALCNAHHLRELERTWEQDSQKWAKQMKALSEEINEVVKMAGGKLSKESTEQFLKRYRAILQEGKHECPVPETITKTMQGRVKKDKG